LETGKGDMHVQIARPTNTARPFADTHDLPHELVHAVVSVAQVQCPVMVCELDACIPGRLGGRKHRSRINFTSLYNGGYGIHCQDYLARSQADDKLN
jgi:hypothetical protein